jgi:hypothetical protein
MSPDDQGLYATFLSNLPAVVCSKQQEEPGCIAAATAFLSAPEQQHLSPFIRTSLLLLAEMARGTESAFAPYIENLPSKSDCLLHWGEEDLALLAGGQAVLALNLLSLLLRRRMQQARKSLCSTCYAWQMSMTNYCSV